MSCLNYSFGSRHTPLLKFRMPYARMAHMSWPSATLDEHFCLSTKCSPEVDERHLIWSPSLRQAAIGLRKEQSSIRHTER
mmetsp:Transcript_1436/g.3851  ORF Transcript_1436/g.3851 Transcript_1436/m.3851 type:complete len:80 (+) Transcript_1436:36-275(+)